MARVRCEVEDIDIEGDYGDVPGVCVRCTRCQHAVEVYGTSGASIRRGLATLREECPGDEDNFYVAGGEP
jgi:hypothetical protein